MGKGKGNCLVLKPGRLGLLVLLFGIGAWICRTGEFEGLTGPQRLAAQGRRPERAASGPLSPAQALAGFELEPGYRIELAAAEPLIADPVAMAFDDRGRMFVVENRGYPGPLEGASTPPPALGVIALLEDSNGDGRFDKRTQFAANLVSPNGILPWNGGVFVTAAPDLLYLKDTNSDGVADQRRTVLTGFDATRTAQIPVQLRRRHRQLSTSI